MKRPHILATVLTATALACLGGGCGGGGANSLLLYNGQHPQLTHALVAAFEKQTGIDVRVRTNDGIVLANQLLQEGKRSPADVYFTENSPELVTLYEHGLLASTDSSTLDESPKRGGSGNWTGITRRISVLAYNPSLVASSALPASILQLAQPRWKGKVAIAPTDSDFVPLVGAVLATHGKTAAQSWLAGLERNAHIYQDDEAVATAVDRGDVATGVINNYYWFRLRLEVGAKNIHSKLYYFPGGDVGGLENISGVAVLAASTHRRNAEKFVNFLVSKPAQEIIAHSDDFEYPIRPEVKPNAALPPLSALQLTALEPVELGDDQPAARLIQESGLA
ncbi:MAG: extracellular solute-binding protein [Solirubrobacteraceae bacterium]